jgi:3-oxoacyl-[acyl-carrier-protein] synthase II
MSRSSDTQVVITGCGAVTPLGADVDSSWDAIRNYRVGYAKNEALGLESNIDARFFGVIEDNKSLFRKFPKTLVRGMPFFARLMLLAASEAVEEAFPDREQLDATYDAFERGVLLGTGYGWAADALPMARSFIETGQTSPFLALGTMHNVATAAASIYWDCRGPQATPVAACASGSMAIGEAVEMIRRGRCKIAIAGAADSYAWSPLSLWTIGVIGALSREQHDIRKASCPFSRCRSGFVPSCGAGAVVLEEMESALRRDANILAEVTGYGLTTDAHDMIAPDANLRARVASVERALADASATPDTVDYVNAHGTSTPANDKNETEVLKRVFGEKAHRIPISSTKSYTGHTIGASGAIETIFCVKTLQDGLMPATINLDEPDPECDLDFIPNQHRPNPKAQRLLNINSGFGGVNTALVIERVTA